MTISLEVIDRYPDVKANSQIVPGKPHDPAGDPPAQPVTAPSQRTDTIQAPWKA